MRLAMLVALVAFLAAPVLAADLYFVELNTGPVPCGGLATSTSLLTNPMVPTKVKATELAVWTAPGVTGNIALTLVANGLVIQRSGWNHYTDPVGPAGQRQSFGADWVSLPPNTQVDLWTQCDAGIGTVHGIGTLTISLD